MPAARFEAFLRRHRVVVDEAKRLGVVEQAARALATPSSIYAFADWPEEVRTAAYRLAAHGEGLPREELGGGALRLVESGLAFPLDGDRLAMPGAYRAQIPASPSESPRAMRLLVGALGDENLHAVASNVLGRTGALPRPLVIGELLDALEPRTRIETEIAACTPQERALLAAIEARGGELETAELLELSREPARYATAGGAVLPRRSIAFSLLRRGLLMGLGPDLYGLPCEVEEVAGRERRAHQSRIREEVRQRASEEDRTPPRAKLASDPGLAVIAMLCGLRAEGVSLGAAGGAPRSAMRKIAAATGFASESTDMLVSLARGEGLHASSRPLAEVGGALFGAWLRGGAWDEARTPEDRHRAHERLSRISTPTVALRSAVVDFLASLPPLRFAPVADVVRAVLGDLRSSSATRVLDRARARDRTAFARDVPAIVERILDGSLPVLGAVDRGVDEGVPVVRLGARAQRLIAGVVDASAPSASSEWLDEERLAVANTARAIDVIALGLAADAALGERGLVLIFGDRTLERAIRAGDPVDRIVARIERLAGSLPDTLGARVEQLARARVPCRLVEASAFVFIEDPALRDAVLADDEAESLFISSSPPDGLLVRPDASLARVRRVVLRHGGDVHATSLPPPENIHDSNEERPSRRQKKP